MLWTWKVKQWRKERRKIRNLKSYIKQKEKKYFPFVGDDIEEAIEIGALDDYFNEVNDAEIEIKRIRTKTLTNKAKKLGLDFDKTRDDWYLTGQTEEGDSYKVLSNFGEAQLQGKFVNIGARQ